MASSSHAAPTRAFDGNCSGRPADLVESIRCEGFGANSELSSTSWSSSNSSLPDAPDAESIEAARGAMPQGFGRNSRLRMETDRFSQTAVGFVFGLGGLGVQVSTALGTKLNMRVGGSFLNLNPQIIEQGIPIDGAVRLRSLYGGVDVFPYHGTFHITPGLTMYNGNRMTATTNIAGGQHFSINDTDYVSDPTDPVHGYFDVSLGRRFAPSVTMGFGNMLKRSANWTLQTDFGVQFIGTPRFTLVMNGSVCTPQDGCTRIQDDPDTVANLAQQQADVNSEIQILRFYPILTTSLSYRFGHKVSTTYWR
jgi:hypothetical protein